MLIRDTIETSCCWGAREQEKEKLSDQIMPTVWSDNGLTGSLAVIITCCWYGIFVLTRGLWKHSVTVSCLRKRKKEREKETAHIAQIMPCSSSGCKLQPWLSTDFTLCFTHETNGCSRECQWLLQPWGWSDQRPVSVEGNSDGENLCGVLGKFIVWKD